MRVIYRKIWHARYLHIKRNVEKVWGARYILGARYLSKNTVIKIYIREYKKVKLKRSHYRPGVAQRVGRGIALLFHDRGTRREWVASSTPRPHFTPGKDPVPILQETGWAPGPVWTGGKSRPHRDSIPDLPARSQSLYGMSYPAHICIHEYSFKKTILNCICFWRPELITKGTDVARTVLKYCLSDGMLGRWGRNQKITARHGQLDPNKVSNVITRCLITA